MPSTMPEIPQEKNKRHYLYHVWWAMMRRCYKPQTLQEAKNYKNRGISVANRWHSVQNFRADILSSIGERPGPGYSLDRYPDNDGNYEYGNVRWATAKEQARNTRHNRILAAFGLELCVQEWAERLGLTCYELLRRLKAEENMENIISDIGGEEIVTAIEAEVETKPINCSPCPFEDIPDFDDWEIQRYLAKRNEGEQLGA